MSQPILEARQLVKTFGRVRALRGANLTVNAGEVMALIGDNGAGKSVMIKCLTGVFHPDEGQVLLEGRPVAFEKPLDARQHGIETVYQDLALADDLDASANLYLGRDLLRSGFLGRLGVLDRARERRGAVEAFQDLGIRLQDVKAPIVSLSGGQRQVVAVARSVAWASKIVILDEPTAALSVAARGHVLDVIRRVRDKGIAVLLVSHNMPEVLEVADRIEVLRLGERVARFDAKEATVDHLVGAMTGSLTQDDAA